MYVKYKDGVEAPEAKLHKKAYALRIWWTKLEQFIECKLGWYLSPQKQYHANGKHDRFEATRKIYVGERARQGK